MRGGVLLQGEASRFDSGGLRACILARHGELDGGGGFLGAATFVVEEVSFEVFGFVGDTSF